MGLTQVKSKQLRDDAILDEDLSPNLRIRLLFVVRVATTTSGTLATAFQNGSTVDGITLATNDIILLKDQSSGQENGVYKVNASGSPTRHIYYNSDAEIRPSTIQVKEGTENGGKLFRLTNTTAITINTTSLVYTEVGAQSGGMTVTSIKTSAYSVGANEVVPVDSTGGSFTLTLPAFPSSGDRFRVPDVGGSAGTNPITIARNGNNINGAASDIQHDVNNAVAEGEFIATYGWKVW